MKLFKRGVEIEMPKEQAEFNLEYNPGLFSKTKNGTENAVKKTDGSGVEPKSLKDQKRKDLLLTAEEMGLKVAKGSTKQKIIDLILESEPIE